MFNSVFSSKFEPVHFKFINRGNNLITLFKPERIIERKSTLFSIVVTGIVAILALPIIIPHLLHGYHLSSHLFTYWWNYTCSLYYNHLLHLHILD